MNFVVERNEGVDILEGDVQKLWNFEALGITEENKVHERFLNDISFTGSRYSVKLPWKEGMTNCLIIMLTA